MKKDHYIGINMFLRELKRLYAFDGYIKNYMEFHQLSSPLRIPEVLFKHFHNDWPIHYRLTSIGNATPSQVCDCLCRNFGTIGVSFLWDGTPEGYHYWHHISQTLSKNLY